MPDIDYWLSRKYAAMDAQNNADMIRANAQANLQGAQAAVIPGTTAAEIAAQKARTAQTLTETALAPALARSTIGLNASNAFQNYGAGLASREAANNAVFQRRVGMIPLTDEQANQYGVTNSLERYTPSPAPLPYSSSTLRIPALEDYSKVFKFAKGTARVPGKGSPKVDSVPAKLAPGEAVLNKPAADGLGRGLIAALNKIGSQKLGLV